MRKENPSIVRVNTELNSLEFPLTVYYRLWYPKMMSDTFMNTYINFRDT